MYENENGEYVEVRTVTEYGEEIKQCRTYQANGWIRINEIYPDGTTTEMYEHEEE